MYEEILYEVDDPVAMITFNRPDRLNALTYRTLDELRHALAAAEADRRVVGIILTGAGRGFSAGMDASALSEALAGGDDVRGTPPELEAKVGDADMGPNFQVTYTYILSIRKPLIAAINGPAAGIALAIACLCDQRFASMKAVFRTAFAQRGLIAEHGTSWILPRLLGPSRALDLLWSPRKVTAEEALQLGLVNRVCEPEQLLGEARSYIEEIAGASSPASLQIMKRQVYEDLMLPLGEAMTKANRLMMESGDRPDFREGVESFVEKRPPRFPRVGK